MVMTNEKDEVMGEHVAQTPNDFEESDVSDVLNDDAHSQNGWIEPDDGTIESYDGSDDDAVSVSEANVQDVVPTQVAHPGKATARTGLAGVISAVITVFGVVPLVISAIAGVEGMPESWYPVLASVAGFFIIGSTIITRVMAIPQVNDLLSKIGLGAKD